MKQKLFFVGIFISILLLPSITKAQVTIGSNITPNTGALLDLKENANKDTNASKGLLLPRVMLEDIGNLYPMFTNGDPLYTDTEKDLHTGLIVYNLKDDPANGLCPGPYVWENSSWNRLLEPCEYTPPSILTIECPITTPIVSGTKGVTMSGTIIPIPYTITGALPYQLTGSSVTYNGLTATVADQSLNSNSGTINITISGSPTNDTGGLYEWSIPIGQGQASCKVNLSVTTPPIGTDCASTNNPGVALVFSYNSKWYAVKIGSLNGNAVAALNEHDTEESALRDPEGLQFCSNLSGPRCVPVFSRDGVRYNTQFFTVNSISSGNNGVVAFSGCTQSMIANPGEMLSYQNASIPPMAASGNLGAITVNGTLYLGYVTGAGGILTTKSIIY